MVSAETLLHWRSRHWIEAGKWYDNVFWRAAHLFVAVVHFDALVDDFWFSWNRPWNRLRSSPYCLATPVQIFWVFTREIQVKISHPFQNDSLLCLDTITALGLQYVFVRKAGRFIGELASVVINLRERNRRLSHGQLSWSFVDELGFELGSRHLWLLAFFKSPKCIFSDGSTYNSWNVAAGVTVAGCHELPTIPRRIWAWTTLIVNRLT